MDILCKLQLCFNKPGTRSSDSYSASLKQHPVPVVEEAVDIMTAMLEHVEQLTLLNCLRRKSTTICTEYANLFLIDIPHATRLLDHIVHWFFLKDLNLVIACHQYECPKKYREVWKELLQGPLDARQI